MGPSVVATMPVLRSRRAALCLGAITMAIVAGVDKMAAQEATPGAGRVATDAVYIQTFGSGNLFKTQGSGANLPPYTLYLRDAADRTLFFAGQADRIVGVVPTNQFIDRLFVRDELAAVLVAPPADTTGGAEKTESVWALTLSYWGVGEDPGELTYQGRLVPPAEAEERFGVTPAPEPTWQNTGAGYLIVLGPPEIAMSGTGVLRLTLE